MKIHRFAKRNAGLSLAALGLAVMICVPAAAAASDAVPRPLAPQGARP